MLARSNLERIQYKSDIQDLDSIIRIKDIELNYYIDEYDNCNTTIDTLSLSISTLSTSIKLLNTEKDSLIKSKNNCKKVILGESILIIVLLILL